MLGTLREHSKSFIIYLLFAMIIVVFVFTFNTGMSRSGSCQSEDNPVYAKVGRHAVTSDQMTMAMNLLPNFLRTPEGMIFALAAGLDQSALMRAELEEITPEAAQSILQAVEMLYLASDEAERLGFKVGDKELAKAMYPASFFKEEKVEGKEGEETRKVFDSKSYNSWVSYGLHASPQEYEEFVRRILLVFELERFLMGVVKTDPMALELAARAHGTKVDLQYVEFSTLALESLVAVSEEEGMAYAAEHADEVKKYYDSHPTKFHADAAWKLAGIQVLAHKEAAAPGDKPAEPVRPTREETDAALKKAQGLLDRISGKAPLLPEGAATPIEVKAEGTAAVEVKGDQKAEPTDLFERFKEVAKRESDDEETRNRSGRFEGWQAAPLIALGPLGRNALEALATAEKGKVVGPVEAENGYWLLLVEDRREKKDLTLEQATGEIGASLLREKKAPELAAAKAEEFLKLARETKDQDLEAALVEFKKSLGGDETVGEQLKVQKTGKFPLSTPGASLPGIGKFDELFKAAFALSAEQPLADKVYVHPDTKKAFVVKLAEKVTAPAEIPADEMASEKEAQAVSGSIPYFMAWLKTLRQKAIDENAIERTPEFNAYVQALQTRILEREARKAKEAGEAVPPPAPEPAE